MREANYSVWLLVETNFSELNLKWHLLKRILGFLQTLHKIWEARLEDLKRQRRCRACMAGVWGRCLSVIDGPHPYQWALGGRHWMASTGSWALGGEHWMAGTEWWALGGGKVLQGNSSLETWGHCLHCRHPYWMDSTHSLHLWTTSLRPGIWRGMNQAGRACIMSLSPSFKEGWRINYPAFSVSAAWFCLIRQRILLGWSDAEFS